MSSTAQTAEGEKILIVDDEPNIRDLLTTSLRFAGFAVRAVGNGTWQVYGSHPGGVYDGIYTPWTGELEMAFMSPDDVSGTLFFTLTKKK